MFGDSSYDTNGDGIDGGEITSFQTANSGWEITAGVNEAALSGLDGDSNGTISVASCSLLMVMAMVTPTTTPIWMVL